MDRRDFIELGISGACALALGCDGADSSVAARSDGGGLADAGGALDAGVPPPTIDPSGPTQFLTWDGGSGPGREVWNAHLRLRWKNPGAGDWLDAAQVPLGDTPYATVDVAAPGLVSADVSTLVARWLSNSEVRGFYLRTDQAFAFHFVGRTGAPEAERPTLTITTDRGEFSAPCLANANWAPGTFRSMDSRESFRVNNGGTLAIVQFDLSGVEGVLESATLRMTCTELRYAGVLSIFEADPPIFRVGGGGEEPVRGISEGYPLDQGIADHASVLFAADFSTIGRPVWGGSATDAEQVEDPATESTYMRGVFHVGNTGSSTLARSVVRGDTDGIPTTVENALYARYYVYLEADWGSTVDGNKMPGWDNRMGWWNPAQGGYWQSTTGNGGSAGTGLKVRNESRGRWEYEGHSIRGLGGEKAGDGNYYDDYFWLAGYVYNLDQEGAYGSGLTWQGTVIARERWVCIEQFVQMNSIVGPFDAVGNGEAVDDGIYRVWVDGVPSYERTNLRWTRHPELGLQGFWLNWYHGGTSPVIAEMHYRMNSVVISREYIGPRKDR